MTTRWFLGLTGAAALTFTLVGPAVAAPEPTPMSPRMLEQTVLRVQMPTTLGTWQQYLYRVDKDQAPTMCWSMKGAVTLPKAPIVGSVNYQVDQATNGWVAIYQYSDKAAADAALAKLRKLGCSDDAKHPTESETMVPAQQGTDFTDSSQTGVASGVTYVDSGTRGYVETATTQRGLAIVQTQVRKFVTGTQTLKQQQETVNRLGAFNQKWHAKVVKAYQSFGVEGTAS
jgi:hypothetical protein